MSDILQAASLLQQFGMDLAGRRQQAQQHADRQAVANREMDQRAARDAKDDAFRTLMTQMGILRDTEPLVNGNSVMRTSQPGTPDFGMPPHVEALMRSAPAYQPMTGAMPVEPERIVSFEGTRGYMPSPQERDDRAFQRLIDEAQGKARIEHEAGMVDLPGVGNVHRSAVPFHINQANNTAKNERESREVQEQGIIGRTVGELLAAAGGDIDKARALAPSAVSSPFYLPFVLTALEKTRAPREPREPRGPQDTPSQARDLAAKTEAGRLFAAANGDVGKAREMARTQVDASMLPATVEALEKMRTGGDMKPPSSSENRALGFYSRAKDAAEALQTMEGAIANKGPVDRARYAWAPNFAQSENDQVYQQAQRQFTEARLRKDSGAAIPPAEYEADARTYFPQPGDKPAVIERKRKARETVLNALRLEAGRAVEALGEQPQQPSTPQSAPQQPQVPGVGKTFNGQKVLKVTKVQ